MKPKRKPPVPKTRGRPEAQGPGFWNPFRSDRFTDRKKKASKNKARGRTHKED